MRRAKKAPKPRPSRPFPKRRYYPNFEILENRLPVSEQIGTLLGLSLLYSASEGLRHGLDPLARDASTASRPDRPDPLTGSNIALLSPTLGQPTEGEAASTVTVP